MNEQLTPRSGTEEFVWPTVGRPGVVPLDALVANPNQPRKHFGEQELDELAGTMKDGPREILTVRELTPEEQAGPYPLPARYMIVSGERRWRAAKRAGLHSIEIRVKAYRSRAYEKLDAFMLNEARVGLSDIENARAIADLAKEFGWETQAEIAQNIGKSQFWVSYCFSLLKLSSVGQAWMMPDVPEGNRLKTQPAVFLVRHVEDHATQDDLIARMPRGRATTLQQIGWLRQELKRLGVETSTRKHKPSTLRRITGYFADQVERRIDVLESSSDIDSIFANATTVQTQELVKRATSALRRLQDFLKRVETLSQKHLLELAEKKRMLTEGVAKRLEVPKTPPVPPPAKVLPKKVEVVRPAVAPTTSRRAPEPVRKPAPPREKPWAPPALPRKPDVPPVAREERPQPTPSRPIPRRRDSIFGSLVSGPAPKREEEVEVDCFDDGIGRISSKRVTLSQYIQLWDEGLLKFQQRGTDKPDHYYTREEAVARLKA